ncbi:hypothetical protein FT663_04078 [Candidozyma haemuli var. vulneris]|uniref:Sm domain-containing protein n=1 Tax=Candidozyma haemuli TaxID=45357 RepID=A0A2V1AVV5_9ASCO|nr:hypothetical protein CXQ85_004586 [[Candida] haemuloni]KAF3988322.1 hypothetical protein FT663_04078 [[Candida] haemuloni var. vulneris]KAF3988404.1 hypothetical protein FT662_03437 [[Candida] haemuloni var. vulneris]PVH21922.1 hypothetical protein CXQ85_004586 [[Candida] haemuloni]
MSQPRQNQRRDREYRGDRHQRDRGDRGDRDDRRDRGDHRENRGGRSTYMSRQERPKKEAIVDLNKYRDEKVVVKFIGGRQVVGVLKGFDQLMNLVLEDVTEQLRDPEDEAILTEKTREFKVVVVRGPSLLTLSPLDGTESIENPFVVEQ